MKKAHGNSNPAGTAIVDELVRSFPDAPSTTLARKAFGENPGVFPSLDAARSCVRARFGVMGKSTKLATHKREKRMPGPWMDELPPALTHFTDWRAIPIEGPLRALVLSDIHVPFHDLAAVRLAIDYGLAHNADTVLLNGDVVDFYAVSQWEKDPRRRDFPGEVRAGRQFLRALRSAFPDARIIFKEGNHEERFERYLRMKAPELIGLTEFAWESVYGLEEFGIERVGEKRPIRLGKLHVIHGHEYRFNISNPVNPARGFFLRAKTHVLGGHMHQTSQHSEKDLTGNVISAWSAGCLCNLHPEWLPLNSWGNGFAYVDVDERGAFRVENLRIIDGKVW